MKSKNKELSVDYIGGQGSLTVIEEEAITQYLTEVKYDKPTKALAP